MKTRFNKLQFQIFLRVMGVITILIVSINIGVVIIVLNQFERNAQQYLSTLIRLSALRIDGDQHARVLDNSQIGTSDYEKIRVILQEIKAVDRNILAVNTLRYVENQVIYVVEANEISNQVTNIRENNPVDDFRSMEQIAFLTDVVVDVSSTRGVFNYLLSAYSPIYTSGGQRDGILVIDYQADAFLGSKLIGGVTVVSLVLLLLAGWIIWSICGLYLRPMENLILGIDRAVQGNLDQRFEIQSPQEFYTLGQGLNQLFQNYVRNTRSFEQRVNIRALEFEKRASYSETALKIILNAVTAMESGNMARQIVNQIRDEFGFYYVGLFSVDSSNSWAELQSGTGRAGQIRLAKNYRVQVGEGMVGWCIANHQPRVSMEVGQDAVRLSTPELPLTRSEAVLPLISRGRTIGALSILSERSGMFDKQILDALTLLANNLAVAIDNAYLYSELQKSILSLQSSIQDVSRQAWLEFLQTQTNLGYQANEQSVAPIASGIIVDSYGNPIKVDSSRSKDSDLYVPVKVRGQVLGILHARKPNESQMSHAYWTAEEIRLMEDMVEQLSLSLDNARLYNTARKSAEREKVLGSITSAVRSSVNINTILQIALQSLAETMHISKGQILLRPVMKIDDPDKSGNTND